MPIVNGITVHWPALRACLICLERVPEEHRAVVTLWWGEPDCPSAWLQVCRPLTGADAGHYMVELVTMSPLQADQGEHLATLFPLAHRYVAAAGNEVFVWELSTHEGIELWALEALHAFTPHACRDAFDGWKGWTCIYAELEPDFDDNGVHVELLHRMVRAGAEAVLHARHTWLCLRTRPFGKEVKGTEGDFICAPRLIGTSWWAGYDRDKLHFPVPVLLSSLGEPVVPVAFASHDVFEVTADTALQDAAVAHEKYLANRDQGRGRECGGA